MEENGENVNKSVLDTWKIGLSIIRTTEKGHLTKFSSNKVTPKNLSWMVSNWIVPILPLPVEEKVETQEVTRMNTNPCFIWELYETQTKKEKFLDEHTFKVFFCLIFDLGGF